jgi:DNA-binding NarL/FixJ family response regulator
MNDVRRYILVEKIDLYRVGWECITRSVDPQAIIYNVHDVQSLSRNLSTAPESIIIIDFDYLEMLELDEISKLATSFPLSGWLFNSEILDETFLINLNNIIPKSSFILKHAEYDQLYSAVKVLNANKRFFCVEAMEVLLSSHTNKKVNPLKVQNARLTQTEQEIIVQLALGKTAKEIAEQRCLSYHTINTHRKNIFKKLRLNNIKELTKYALKNGLVDLTEYYI